MNKEDITTIDALIRALERKKQKHGGDAGVLLEGYDPCRVRVVENDEDPEMYPHAKVLISS